MAPTISCPFARQGVARWTVTVFRLAAIPGVFEATRRGYGLLALVLLAAAMASGPVGRWLARRSREHVPQTSLGFDDTAGRALMVAVFYLLAADRWIAWGAAHLLFLRQAACLALLLYGLQSGRRRGHAWVEKVWTVAAVAVACLGLLMPLVISLAPWPDLIKAFERFITIAVWTVVIVGWALLPIVARRFPTSPSQASPSCSSDKAPR